MPCIPNNSIYKILSYLNTTDLQQASKVATNWRKIALFVKEDKEFINCTDNSDLSDLFLLSLKTNPGDVETINRRLNCIIKDRLNGVELKQLLNKALLKACSLGDKQGLPLVELLIKNKADINGFIQIGMGSADKRFAWEEAIGCKAVEIFKYFLAHNNKIDPSQALIKACQNLSIEIVQFLLTQKLNINAFDEEGRSALKYVLTKCTAGVSIDRLSRIMSVMNLLFSNGATISKSYPELLQPNFKYPFEDSSLISAFDSLFIDRIKFEKALANKNTSAEDLQALFVSVQFAISESDKKIANSKIYFKRGIAKLKNNKFSECKDDLLASKQTMNSTFETEILNSDLRQCNVYTQKIFLGLQSELNGNLGQAEHYYNQAIQILNDSKQTAQAELVKAQLLQPLHEFSSVAEEMSRISLN